MDIVLSCGLSCFRFYLGTNQEWSCWLRRQLRALRDTSAPTFVPTLRPSQSPALQLISSPETPLQGAHLTPWLSGALPAHHPASQLPLLALHQCRCGYEGCHVVLTHKQRLQIETLWEEGGRILPNMCPGTQTYGPISSAKRCGGPHTRCLQLRMAVWPAGGACAAGQASMGSLLSRVRVKMKRIQTGSWN